MSDTTQTEPTPAPPPAVSPAPPLSPEEAARKLKLKRKRIYGFIAIVVFVGFGVFYFGGRMPREVHLRFDLPPVARNNSTEIPRARVSLVTAVIAGGDGAQLASVNLPIRDGLEGPRTAPVVINLRAGHYLVRARIRSFETTEVPLEGSFDADDGEVVVDLH